ncbi:dehydrodolichyl diphosphate synthase complex subunit nus1 [Daktulosphaira vitifoliae]|uniref:dehydrodolichyl diphosphate synthase complex subunit nus1 n=1 Tax=Daktulosphaira vitifoliae TaxID=58002 RepID=UPI0021AA5FA3|nr:dehydrodolichyl diphosphate synthase complex subunit nus1 [Daktulosphaira vitifoliae]
MYDILKLLFSSILFLAHFFYAIYSWLIDQNIIRHYYDPWHNRSSVEDMKHSLEKAPNHLVISVCQEEVSYEDVSKIIAWSLFLEIPIISFYHNKNGIKPEEIYVVFKKKYQNLLTKLKWGIEFSDDVIINSKKSINGFKWEPRTQVNVLTSKHSRMQLVHVLQNVCSLQEEFSDKLIESIFDKVFPLSEPDLVVICGDSCTTFGLLPWHTRVTEFLTLKTHYNIDFMKFFKLLEEYSGHEQRYGK